MTEGPGVLCVRKWHVDPICWASCPSASFVLCHSILKHQVPSTVGNPLQYGSWSDSRAVVILSWRTLNSNYGTLLELMNMTGVWGEYVHGDSAQSNVEPCASLWRWWLWTGARACSVPLERLGVIYYALFAFPRLSLHNTPTSVWEQLPHPLLYSISFSFSLIKYHYQEILKEELTWTYSSRGLYIHNAREGTAAWIGSRERKLEVTKAINSQSPIPQWHTFSNKAPHPEIPLPL